MRKLAILCAAAAASAGLAQALADPPGKTRKAAADPNQILCRTEPEPGSRMRRRICLTRAQWQALRDQSRSAADDMQRFKPVVCGPDTNTGMMC